MSSSYRKLGDNWAKDRTVQDAPVDKSEDFGEVKTIMDEIHDSCQKLHEYREGAADFLVDEMCRLVYGSNKKAKRCTELGLDETIKLCMQIFAGDAVEYLER